MKVLTRLSVLAVAVAMGVAGCTAGSGDGTDTSTDQSDDTGSAAEQTADSVAIGLIAPPANLDMANTDGAAIPEALLGNVYETLVELDDTGEFQPNLATEWSISDDGLTYEFTLRDDAVFSNGTPFTADSVKFSINAVRNDWEISLAEAMNVVDTVEVLSPTEVRVTLSQRSNDWLFRMTTRIGAMMSPDGVDNMATTAVGTGPFEVAEFVNDERLVLVARDDYWGPTPGYDEVELRYFNDGAALNNALLGGDINVVGTVQAPESLPQFETGEFEIIEGTTNGEVVLSMNHRSEALSDVRVRRAIRHAIDNEAVMQTAWAGYGEQIGSMVPPTDPWYEDRTGDFPLDREQARALLAEAGATDLDLRLRVPDLEYAPKAAQTVQSNLREVGIETEIEVLEFPAVWLEEVFTNHDYDLSIVAHVEPRDMAILADPDYYFGFDNADVQDLMAQADQASLEERNELLADAAEVISTEAAAEFLFLAPNLIVSDGTVDGLPANDIRESFDLASLTPRT